MIKKYECMKKWRGFILVIACSLCLAGCNKLSEEEAGTFEENVKTGEKSETISDNVQDETTADYDEKFFDENTLIQVYTGASSGDYRFDADLRY